MTKKLITHKNKTKRNLQIAEDRLNGATYRELTAKYAISNASISRILNKDEIQDVLQTALNHLVTFAPIVVKNYRDLLNSDKPSIRLKATEALAKIIGLTPSHTPTQVNMLITNTHNSVVISDQMRDILNKISGNDDFIDAEFSAIIDD